MTSTQIIDSQFINQPSKCFFSSRDKKLNIHLFINKEKEKWSSEISVHFDKDDKRYETVVKTQLDPFSVYFFGCWKFTLKEKPMYHNLSPDIPERELDVHYRNRNLVEIYAFRNGVYVSSDCLDGTLSTLENFDLPPKD